MDVSSSEAFLDQLITNQRKAIRFYWSFVGGLVILGLILIAFAFLLPLWLPSGYSKASGSFQTVSALGASFVLAMNAFPYKEVARGRERIQGYEMIRTQIRRLGDIPKAKRVRTETQIEDLLWKSLEKTALG